MGRTINDIYGSRFINNEDVADDPVNYLIVGLRIHTFADGNGTAKDKICLSLDGHEKEFAVGPQNAAMMAEWFGDEFDGWVGKTISLHRGKKQFGNRRVDAVILQEAQEF